MTTYLTSRAQRLIDEFEEGQDVRHGIAKVLRHIAETEYDYESWYHIPQHRLQDLAAELTAPTLLDRALSGDKAAARQFLQELGFIDEHGQIRPPYRPEDLNDD